MTLHSRIRKKRKKTERKKARSTAVHILKLRRQS